MERYQSRTCWKWQCFISKNMGHIQMWGQLNIPNDWTCQWPCFSYILLITIKEKVSRKTLSYIFVSTYIIILCKTIQYKQFRHSLKTPLLSPPTNMFFTMNEWHLNSMNAHTYLTHTCTLVAHTWTHPLYTQIYAHKYLCVYNKKHLNSIHDRSTSMLISN